jgi:hypothetical protein
MKEHKFKVGDIVRFKGHNEAIKYNVSLYCDTAIVFNNPVQVEILQAGSPQRFSTDKGNRPRFCYKAKAIEGGEKAEKLNNILHGEGFFVLEEDLLANKTILEQFKELEI